MAKLIVKLTGTDGNVFSIIGAVSRALKKAGLHDDAREFTKKATGCESYDKVLQLVMKTVEVR